MTTPKRQFTCLHGRPCKYWNWDWKAKPNGMIMASCDAFPGGIPQDIIDGTIDHTKPYLDNDRGLMYEAATDDELNEKVTAQWNREHNAN